MSEHQSVGYGDTLAVSGHDGSPHTSEISAVASSDCITLCDYISRSNPELHELYNFHNVEMGTQSSEIFMWFCTFYHAFGTYPELYDAFSSSPELVQYFFAHVIWSMRAGKGGEEGAAKQKECDLRSYAPQA